MDDDSAVTLLVTIIADRVRQHIRLCLSRGCDKTPHSTEAAFMNSLHDKIRTIPDFPKPGVSYRDITPLVADPKALRLCVHQLIHPFVDERVLVVFDVLATVGSAAASCALIEKLGAEVAACAVVNKHNTQRGRDRLS